MKTEKVILSALSGTTAMTIFSYLVSEAKNKNFKEPEVLAALVKRLVPEIKEGQSQIAGWSLHYLLGYVFTLVFDQLYKRKNINPDISNTLSLGAVSGLIGIIIWYITFKIHPNPPSKNLKRYFGHLLLAHFVFTAFAEIVFAEDKHEREKVTG